MKIYATTEFLDGYDRFKESVVYDVPDEKGKYFIACGWAREFLAVEDGVVYPTPSPAAPEPAETPALTKTPWYRRFRNG